MGYYWYYVPVKENCMRKLSPTPDWHAGFSDYRYVILLWNGRTDWRRHIITGLLFFGLPSYRLLLSNHSLQHRELPVLQFTHEMYSTGSNLPFCSLLSYGYRIPVTTVTYQCFFCCLAGILSKITILKTLKSCLYEAIMPQVQWYCNLPTHIAQNQFSFLPPLR